MSLSVADLDLSRLDDEDRETLTLIALPKEERDASIAEIASDLGLDSSVVKSRLERLYGSMRAIAGNQLPPLADDEYAALRDSIEKHGQLVPILTTFDGELVDGHHRLRACEELGLTPRFEAAPADADADELRSWAFVVNVARRHLTASARVGLVEAALIRDASRSDRGIASEIGVSHTFVAKVRRQLEDARRVESVATRRDVTGRQQPATKPSRTTSRDSEISATRDSAIGTTRRESPAPPARETRDAETLTITVPGELLAAGDSWLLARAVRLVQADDGYVLEIRR